MRKDMSQIITGTYRVGRADARAIIGARRKYRNLDPDGAGGMKRIGMHGDIFAYTDRKGFDDHLGPLERYLKRQVYRAWNDVYHDICSRADHRSVIHWHLLFHVGLLVETNTVLLDGEVVLSACDRHRPIAKSTCAVYVHPVTGLLMPVAGALSPGLGLCPALRCSGGTQGPRIQTEFRSGGSPPSSGGRLASSLAAVSASPAASRADRWSPTAVRQACQSRSACSTPDRSSVQARRRLRMRTSARRELSALAGCPACITASAKRRKSSMASWSSGWAPCSRPAIQRSKRRMPCA